MAIMAPDRWTIFGASPDVGRKRECVVGATGIEPVTPTCLGSALPSPPLVVIFGEDSNLQPDRYELGRTRTSNQAVMSEPLRLRKERIFAAHGTRGLNVPARHAVLSNESKCFAGT